MCDHLLLRTSCLDPLWGHVVVVTHGAIGLGSKTGTQEGHHLMGGMAVGQLMESEAGKEEMRV